jgi:hypothetical protein
VLDKDVPGPGKYDLLSTLGFGQNSLKYSMSKEGRKKRWKSEILNYEEPGPGQYESPYNPKGNYHISTLKNTPNNLWSNSKTDRFKNKSK